MSVHEFPGFIADSYGTEVSREFIGSVTDEVMAEALRPAYTAVSEPVALAELEAFEAGPWGRKC